MLFRKTRTHFQGSSNRSSSRHQSDSKPFFSKTASNFKELVESTKIKNPFTSALKKRNKNNKFFSSSHNINKNSLSFQEEDKAGSVQKQLRRMFKNSRDMVKLLNHWGFDEKGFISKVQFHQAVNRKMGCEVEQKDIDMIMRRHSASQDHIDSHGLIQMLLGKTEGIPMDYSKLSFSSDNKNRQTLVDNLKEDLKNYQKGVNSDISDHNINLLLAKFNSSVSRIRKNGTLPSSKSQFFESLKNNNTFNSFEEKLINYIEKTVDFKQMSNLLERHKNADYLFVDPLVRNKQEVIKNKINAKRQCLATQADLGSTFSDKMKSLPNLFQKTLKSQDRRAPFDPLSLLNVDQRKTRFQKSQFTTQSNGWFANSNSQAIMPDQKNQVLQVLNDQVALKQARYENKLSKMRMNREKEQQNIVKRDEDLKMRETGRLQRFRQQQEAYNYINYIKKRWQ